MTLLELLIKELPSRGGWPEHSGLCWQDGDGEIRFSGDVCDDFYSEVLADDRVEVGYHPIINGTWGCVAKKVYFSKI